MRMLGVILVVVGIIALAVPSITFWTTEQVADAGFFQVNVEKPHTIILNPFVGIVALAVGAIMLLMGGRSTAT